jgi:hypothetical protein
MVGCILISTIFINSASCGDFGLTVADSTDTCYHKSEYLPDQISISPDELLIKLDTYFAADTGERQLWFTCLAKGRGFTRYCKPIYRTMVYTKMIEILKRDTINKGTAIYRLVYGQFSRELQTDINNALKTTNSAKARKHLEKANKIIEDTYDHKWIVIN